MACHCSISKASLVSGQVCRALDLYHYYYYYYLIFTFERGQMEMLKISNGLFLLLQPKL